MHAVDLESQLFRALRVCEVDLALEQHKWSEHSYAGVTHVDHRDVLRHLLLLCLRPHQLVPKADRDFVGPRPIPVPETACQLGRVCEVGIGDEAVCEAVPMRRRGCTVGLESRQIVEGDVAAPEASQVRVV